MYRLSTTAVFATNDPFPSVSLISGLPDNPFSDTAVISGPVSLNLIGALGPGDIMEPIVTADGIYYSLDGHALAAPGQPIQPLFFADVSVSGWSVRSVVFKGGSYETLTDFDPVIASPRNDYMTETMESALDGAGWYPRSPLGVQHTITESSLVVQLGQYDPLAEETRLYSTLDFDLYYSLSTDQRPPTVTVATALYNANTSQITLKVGAIDDAGVTRVLANYTIGTGEWHSIELVFDATTFKWRGSFTGDLETRYFIQAVDGSGNVALVNNKGRYLTPVADTMSEQHFVYLPLVLR